MKLCFTCSFKPPDGTCVFKVSCLMDWLRVWESWDVLFLPDPEAFSLMWLGTWCNHSRLFYEKFPKWVFNVPMDIVKIWFIYTCNVYTYTLYIFATSKLPTPMTQWPFLLPLPAGWLFTRKARHNGACAWNQTLREIRSGDWTPEAGAHWPGHHLSIICCIQGIVLPSFI